MVNIGPSSTARWTTFFSPIPPFDREMMRHEHAKAHNLLHPEYKVLMMDGSTPTTKMGRILCASESNVTAIVEKLLSEGKVERIPDEGDRGHEHRHHGRGEAVRGGGKNQSRGESRTNAPGFRKEVDTLYPSLGNVRAILEEIKEDNDE